MGRISQHARVALLACFAFSNATAAPALTILYHESIRPQTHLVSGHIRSMSFEAYGRHFNLALQPNEAMRHAIPAGRSDIEALRGQIEGLPKSWVRMTRTRTGWHGVVSDGQEMYAIEPASDVAEAVVQSLAGVSGSSPVMYRLKDALLPVGPAYCEILNPDDTPYNGTDLVASTGNDARRMTAQALYDSIVKDITTPVVGPDLELTVGVVADYEFYQAFIDDPQGAIIARMDIVDGIWSSQVGVKIALAPLTIVQTPDEPFTKFDPGDLLAEVKQYRKSHPEQLQTGVTHLMTGRNMDGDIVGIAYLGTVCDGKTADSLSEGAHSATMSALIAAHELGHNFNAPHDGQPGACATTPQTFLMAPRINFSDQFSSCSLDQIDARIKTASCLTPYQAPDVVVELPATSVGAVVNTAFTLSFVAHAIGDDPSTDVTATAALPGFLTLQSASAAGGICTPDGASVACSLGKLMPQETRQIDLTVVGSVTGTGNATVGVTSPNDTVAADNTADISIEVSAAPPPSPPPVTAPVTSSGPGDGGGGGGGGGGGSLDFVVLAMLTGAAASAAFQRRRIQ